MTKQPKPTEKEPGFEFSPIVLFCGVIIALFGYIGMLLFLHLTHNI